MRTFTAVAALVVVLGLPSPSPARSTHDAGTTPTTTTVAVVPNPSVAGQSVTLTATVRPGEGVTGTPSGAVQFLQLNGIPLGSPPPLQHGQTSMLVWAYTGTYTVGAVYNGDATFETSTGAADMVVERAGTMTTVCSSSNPVSIGGSLSLTVFVGTVAPGYVAPAGTVDILLNGFDVSGPIPLFDYTDTVRGVVVTVPSEWLTQPGTATISARYTGDAYTKPSLSDGFAQSVVGPAPAPSPTPVPTVRPTPKPPTTAAALSAMTGTLRRALARRGISALTVTKQRLSVAGPGTLVQDVYSPAAPASATSSAAKSVRIATGSRAFPAAGTGTLTLRLTAAGRRAVRKGKALKIEIVTRFTDPSGAVVRSSNKLTVKPRAKSARWTFARPAVPPYLTAVRPAGALLR